MASDIVGKTIPKDKGIAGWIVENGQPVRIADVKRDERFNPDIDALTGYETKSVLCVPLDDEDRRHRCSGASEQKGWILHRERTKR